MQLPLEELTIFLPGNLLIALLIFTVLLVWNGICGWVIYQCAIEPENALARFLSAPVFQPLSRLTYGLFLGHLMTTWFNVMQTRTTVSLSSNGLAQLVSSTLVQSLVIAYYLYLTWEVPFERLVKLLMATKKDRVKKE